MCTDKLTFHCIFRHLKSYILIAPLSDYSQRSTFLGKKLGADKRIRALLGYEVPQSDLDNSQGGNRGGRGAPRGMGRGGRGRGGPPSLLEMPRGGYGKY